MPEQNAPLVVRMNPINFWVKHLSVIIGFIGLWYLTTETQATLPKIPIDELAQNILIYSLICYAFVLAYFLVHYATSVLGRAKDAAIPMWIASILTAAAIIGVVGTILTGNTLALTPLALLYLMVLMPSDLFARSEEEPAAILGETAPMPLILEET